LRSNRLVEKRRAFGNYFLAKDSVGFKYRYFKSNFGT